ncbi:Mobile element protein [Rhodococcus aetherivorans]|nr:Mobile element protein [Rhodococcus aetherivorans]
MQVTEPDIDLPVGNVLTRDKAWAQIEPLLPASGRGGQWRDHRQVINAILWKLRTGAPWRDLPERYGPWKTAHERLRKWTMDGTWEKILDAAVVKDDAVGEVEWIVSVDSTVVRAHQHSAEPLGCLLARTWAASRIAADQSRSPPAPSRSRTRRCNSSNTPALTQAAKRRCAVGTLTPNDGGRCRQAQPLVST